MKRRKLGPKALRRMDQASRARKLAEMSHPLIAELYLTHAQICEAGGAPNAVDGARHGDGDTATGPRIRVPGDRSGLQS